METTTNSAAKVTSRSEEVTVFVPRLLGTKFNIKVKLQGAATKTPWDNLAELYPTLGDLAQVPESKLLRLRGVGPKGIKSIAYLFNQAGVAWTARDGFTIHEDRNEVLAGIVQTALSGLARLNASAEERALVLQAIRENKPLEVARIERESDLAVLIAANIAALTEDDD